MKLCYVDETGTDGKSPVILMVGVVADSQRLRRTQADFLDLFTKMGELSPKTLRELKAADLYRGNDAWRGVAGSLRHQLVSDLCDWLCDRKHNIALAAIDRERFDVTPLAEGLDAWMTVALHISLQVQHAHQKVKKNKGATFLVFDEHYQHSDELAELLFEPPEWTDGYYRRKASQARLDQVIDSAFYARSHHVGLVQIADLFAFLFRRYAELTDYGASEDFVGETEAITTWVTQVSARLLPKASRWAKSSREPTMSWYRDAAPPSLVALG